MKILLINPKVASGWAPYTVFPLGLAYLLRYAPQKALLGLGRRRH